MKPSERVTELSKAVAQRRLPPEHSPTATELRAAVPEAIVAYLDEMHEKLQRLERLAQPARYVVPPHALSQAERAKLAREIEGSGMLLLPPGSSVVAANRPAPIPCSVALPEEEVRVLFYIAGEREPWRWKTGWRVPNGYHDPGKIWRADETSVGDELMLYTAEQVTHWLPLPGEPT